MAKPPAKHYKLMRDDARPLEFDGWQVAVAEFQDTIEKLARAAVYRTVGGKFVSEYSKSHRFTDGEKSWWQIERAKVAYFDTLEDAAEWFRPGPITTALLAKLQEELTGERIE